MPRPRPPAVFPKTFRFNETVGFRPLGGHLRGRHQGGHLQRRVLGNPVPGVRDHARQDSRHRGSSLHGL
eukprot:9791351-Lingulodinium_polyedra.AAC.1